MRRNTLRILVLIFGAITAIIHLALGIQFLGTGAMPILFLLNAAGYAVLTAVVAFNLLPAQRALAHYALMAFAAVTLVAYFAINGFGANPMALVTKLDELLLIIVTFLHLRADA
jgi:hypothetical protein